MLDRMFTAAATRIAGFTGQPGAFVTAVGIIVLWSVTGPLFGYSDTWQLVVNTATTIVTFLMVFLIQNAQNRDAQALHLKLDELIRAQSGARNKMIDLENLTEKQLQRLQAEFDRICEEEDEEFAEAVDDALEERQKEKNAA